MLQVRNLHYSIGDRDLLTTVDWNLKPSERFALVGPNGSGKTTLQRIMTGETRFSFSLGGSIKVVANERFGFRFQANWIPTYINTKSEVWCDWWGFCYAIPPSQYMSQGEFTGGNFRSLDHIEEKRQSLHCWLSFWLSC